MTPYSGADTFASSFLIPDDGDADEAASFNVAYEALGDRTTWLKNRTPDFSYPIRTYSVATGTATILVQGASTATITLAPLGVVAAGDVMFVDFCTDLKVVNSLGSTTGLVQLQVAENGGSWVNIPGARAKVGRNSAAADGDTYFPCNLSGYHQQVASGSVAYQALFTALGITAPDSFQAVDDWTFRVIMIRAVP